MGENDFSINKIVILRNFICVIILFSFTFCKKENKTNGPYFGNGIKNGWADQNSIVIWTRLTKNKNAFFEGKPFIEISNKKMLSLARMPNVDSIYSLQIPKGLSLKDMEGYCPGSNGQVKLHYSPQIPIRLNIKYPRQNEAFILIKKRNFSDKNYFYLTKNKNLKEAAKNLYKTLRLIKNKSFKCIAVESIPNKGFGEAINDRLIRASKF